MKTKTGWIRILAAVLLFSPLGVQAIPVTYGFTTDAANLEEGGLPSPVLDALVGLSVTGTFKYDAVGEVVGTVADGTTAGSLAYPTLSDLSGSVGGQSFSDPAGITIVGALNLPVPTPFTPADYLALDADPRDPAGVSNLNGFDVGAFSLVNVRLFWLEYFIASAPDFLADDSLPGMLPTFAGRLGLDFTSAANPSGPLTFVFFENLRVVPVPMAVSEPSALALLALGLLAITLRRRRHRA
jgi:hypothetical protein